MATNSTELPIYKAAYDLLDVITDLAKNMPRDFKLSLGGKLRDEAIDIVTLIFRANEYTDKVPHLTLLIERLRVAELLLRLSRDKRLISIGQYAAAVKLTQNVGRQAGGWRRSAKPQRPPHDGQGHHA